ncbi:MAG: hypothetical protein ACRC0L_09725, partial [Angustibacter sp.]
MTESMVRLRVDVNWAVQTVNSRGHLDDLALLGRHGVPANRGQILVLVPISQLPRLLRQIGAELPPATPAPGATALLAPAPVSSAKPAGPANLRAGRGLAGGHIDAMVGISSLVDTLEQMTLSALREHFMANRAGVVPPQLRAEMRDALEMSMSPGAIYAEQWSLLQAGVRAPAFRIELPGGSTLQVFWRVRAQVATNAAGQVAMRQEGGFPNLSREQENETWDGITSIRGRRVDLMGGLRGQAGAQSADIAQPMSGAHSDERFLGLPVGQLRGGLVPSVDAARTSASETTTTLAVWTGINPSYSISGSSTAWALPVNFIPEVEVSLNSVVQINRQTITLRAAHLPGNAPVQSSVQRQELPGELRVQIPQGLSSAVERESGPLASPRDWAAAPLAEHERIL